MCSAFFFNFIYLPLTPLQTFVSSTLGPSWSLLMPLMVCALLVGSINGTIFQSSRLLHSASRGGFLPAFVSCTNPETDAPRAALLVTLFMVFTMNLAADLHTLLNYIGFAQWSMRGITMVVLFYIKYTGGYPQADTKDARVVKAPLVVPVLFFLICMTLVGLVLAGY